MIVVFGSTGNTGKVASEVLLWRGERVRDLAGPIFADAYRASSGS